MIGEGGDGGRGREGGGRGDWTEVVGGWVG